MGMGTKILINLYLVLIVVSCSQWYCLYILFICVQGSKLPIVDSADFVIIIMGHAKMSSLRHAAGNTHVEVHCGGAAVIARAAESAINPTEGQKALQLGFNGAILGGESRENVSTSTDVEGILRVDRVVERSVVSEDGQTVLVQSVQQSAQQLPPLPNIDMSNMVTKVQFDASMSGIIDTFGLIKDSMEGIGKSLLVGNDSVVKVLQVVTLKCAEVKQYVDDEVLELQQKTAKKLMAMKKNIESKMQATDEERNAKDTESDAKYALLEINMKANDKKLKRKDRKRDAKDEERDAKDEERDAKDEERDARDKKRDAKDKKRDALIAVLQRDHSKGTKRSVENDDKGPIPKKIRNISHNAVSNTWGYNKIIDKIAHKKKGFKTMEEARNALAEILDNSADEDTTANDSD